MFALEYSQRGTNINVGTHWGKLYSTKAPDQVSWYRPHLETSLALIQRTTAGPHASIIDVGGGQSPLVDDLLTAGFRDVTILDISPETLVTANLFRTRSGRN